MENTGAHVTLAPGRQITQALSRGESRELNLPSHIPSPVTLPACARLEDDNPQHPFGPVRTRQRRLSTPAAPALTPAARKALTQFDALGRLVRWPHKFSVQRLAMWVLWTQFDGKRVYTEREVNAVIKRWHTWGDHVTLRRELINHRLLTRKSDGSEYRKLPARPDEEVRWLLRAWRERVRQGD